MCTINEVGVVAAFPQLHHGVKEVRDAGSSTTSSSSSSTSFGEEGEVLLQNGSIVFLLDVGELHLNNDSRSIYFLFHLMEQDLSF